MEAAVAAEEGGGGDDAAPGPADDGGAEEERRIVRRESEEDLRDGVVYQLRRRRHGGVWRRAKLRDERGEVGGRAKRPPGPVDMLGRGRLIGSAQRRNTAERLRRLGQWGPSRYIRAMLFQLLGNFELKKKIVGKFRSHFFLSAYTLRPNIFIYFLKKKLHI